LVFWEETIEAIAYERATEESLELWGQPHGEKPRFNYRWEHLQAVKKLCDWLGRALGADMEVLTSAVWLHDTVKSHTPEQAAVSDADVAAEEARRILLGTDFPSWKVDTVCNAIRLHEGLYKDYRIEQLEAAILWDADKLSKLGATHLVHNLCIRPAFDPLFQGSPTDTDLVLRSEMEWLEMGARIVASMNTEPARREAERRLNYLKQFVGELRGEWEKS
jgi:uncharacterized protein